jgi:hypothetical protein
VAWAAVPLGVAWVANAWWLGRRQEQLAGEPAAQGAPAAAASLSPS